MKLVFRRRKGSKAQVFTKRLGKAVIAITKKAIDNASEFKTRKGVKRISVIAKIVEVRKGKTLKKGMEVAVVCNKADRGQWIGKKANERTVTVLLVRRTSKGKEDVIVLEAEQQGSIGAQASKKLRKLALS